MKSFDFDKVKAGARWGRKQGSLDFTKYHIVGLNSAGGLVIEDNQGGFLLHYLSELCMLPEKKVYKALMVKLVQDGIVLWKDTPETRRYLSEQSQSKLLKEFELEYEDE